MRPILVLALALVCLLSGCLRPPGLVGLRSPVADLAGQVRWGEGFGIQATTTEVAQAATVSLIDPATGNTVTTTLTRPDGSFSLTFARWTPTADRPYLLEALKGLSVGGSPNRAGASAARIRTLISKVNGSWTSLTGPTIQITRGTTALCVVASLKGLTTTQQQALMGKLTPNSGPPETYAATPDLAAGEYASVYALVNTALTANQDPLRVIARNAVTGAYTRFERGPVVTDLSSPSGQTGDTLVLSGNGFDAVAANNQVFFNGVPATGVTVNATGTQLTVTIPDAATTGPLTLRVGNLVMLAASTFTIRGSTVLTIAGLNTPIAGRPATEWYVNTPHDVAADAAGYAYVISQHQILRIAPDDTFSVIAGTSTAGFAGDGGPAIGARLYFPSALALDGAGNLYVADKYNYRIRMIPKVSGTYFGQAMVANNIYTVVGNGGYGNAADGTPTTSAPLAGPNAVAVDAAGSLYIADGSNNRVRMVPVSDGTQFGKAMTANRIYAIAGNGGDTFNGNGLAATASAFGEVLDIAVDSAGNVFFYTPYDQFEGWDDEYGEYYWYTDYSPRVRMLPKTTGTFFGQAMTANTLYTVAGSGAVGLAADGTAATAAAFSGPCFFTLDAAGHLLVSDGGNHRIRMVPRADGTYYGRAMAANKVYTVAGTGASGFGGDGGPATSASLRTPRGLGVDATGNLFIADASNHRVRLVAKSSTALYGQPVVANAIYTLAGNGTTPSSYTGDGGPAANSKLNSPAHVALDADGNVFFLDRSYYRVRMIPKVSGTYFGRAMTADNIYTVVGNGTSGNAADGTLATSAPLGYMSGLAVDGAGNLYLSDTSYNRIRMVPRTAGTYFGKAMAANSLYIIAGSGGSGFAGDGGPATGASFYSLGGLALDGAGNVYVTDAGNHRVRLVPRVSGTYFGVAATANNIYTIAGTGGVTWPGDGAAARSAAFSWPSSLALDADGNLYFTSSLNEYSDYDEEGYYYTITYDTPSVRMIPRISGTYFGRAMAADAVYTIAGAAAGPLGVALDSTGNVYFSDGGSHRVYMVPRTSGRRYGRTMTANTTYAIVGTGTGAYNGDGDASTTALHTPTGVAVGPGELFIADSINNLIRKVF